MAQATYQDADLLLRVFEMRREPKLRESRDFMGKLSFRDLDDFKRKHMNNRVVQLHWGKVFGYWEMVCTLVDRGLLNEDLFNATNNEHVWLWAKYRDPIRAFRERYGEPEMLASVERVALRHPWYQGMERWMMSEQQRARKPAKAKAPKARRAAR